VIGRETAGGTAAVNGSISGSFRGIDAQTSGTGVIDILTGAPVVGDTDDGIEADSVDGDITVTLGGNVTGAADGISAEATGAGNVTITGAGDVTGDSDGSGTATDDGINAATASGNVVVDVDGTITGAPGIVATSSGGGDVSVTGTGDVSDSLGTAILAASSGGDGNVTVNRDGNIDGQDIGIDASTTGDGAAGGTGSGTLDVDVTGTNKVDGGTTGIMAGVEEGTGTVDIASGATVRSGVNTPGDGNTGVPSTGIATDGGGVAGGQITVTNEGTIDSDNHTGSEALAAGAFVDTVFDNLAGGEVFGNASSDADAGAVTVSNAGEWALNPGGTSTFAGGNDTITNTGMLSFDNSTVAGAESFTNSGMMVSDGSSTVDGPFTQTAAGTLDQQDGATGDDFTITGDAQFGGTLAYDVDLSGVTDDGDLVTVDGTVSGNAELAFDNTGGTFGNLGSPIPLIQYGTGNTLSTTQSGLPNAGAIVYSIVDDAGSNTIQLESGLNPGINVAANIALTQSIIGSVINRPTSPFVSGLAVPGDNPCGEGAWVRGTGGRAEASTDVTNALGQFHSEIDASFGGLQIGGDFSCFDGHFGGWDMSFGGFAGLNSGSTDQPVFAFDAATGGLDRGNVTSVTSSDFDQYYGGLYVVAARGGFVADLQVRREKTEYDMRNRAAGTTMPPVNFDSPIGLTDQRIDTDAYTVSGSLSYSIPLDEKAGLDFVPTAGFALTEAETDTIQFENNPANPNDDSSLTIEDSEVQIGFIGATLAKTTVRPEAASAINYFATGTVYHDFASDTVSVFETSDGSTTQSSSEPLGTYGELSLGLNYVKVLQNGGSGAARQFNTSVRLDLRHGEDVDSAALTAQARLQF